MNNKDQIFKVQVETGEIMDARLLACVSIDGKDYAIYTIPNSNGKLDILASYVVMDEEGYDSLKDIDNEEDREKISNYLNSLMS